MRVAIGCGGLSAACSAASDASRRAVRAERSEPKIALRQTGCGSDQQNAEPDSARKPRMADDGRGFVLCRVTSAQNGFSGKK
jgi:hypothetical protein